MRQITQAALAVLVAVTLSGTEGSAQQISRVGPPAETPPASFEGTQFVDSRGFVYVRAGVDGSVNWVPRVSRNRQPICGQTPTFQQQTIEVAQSEPVIVTPAPVAAALQAAPRPAPQRVRSVPNRTVSNQKYAPARHTRQERIVPKHVYDAQGDTLPPIPKGYKPAWEDDRLNPHRAHQTRQGYRATQQILSNTVPRRALSAPQDIRNPVIVGRGKGLGH